MKYSITILLCLFTFLCAEAQVTLLSDFTDDSYQKAPLHNIWTVANRISPQTGGGVREGIAINTVRMIGGINKKVNGEKVPYPEFDPCRYDTATSTYIYNWTPLKSRIDAILNRGTRIHQIVLDQPPWAFQHGYTFIPEGTRDSIHFREDERVTGYGNSLPPADKEAYHDFIKALVEELIATYGQSMVESWRFRVGSEIETPDHWKGSKQDFIEHYANTANAVRSVLPGAKVGLHTRAPNFIYKEGTVLNYVGEPIASFASDLIEYCYENNVQYDFWGVSDYVLINNSSDRDISLRYDELIAPLVNHPKWNSNASIDIMEYEVVTSMNPPDGGSTLACVTSHTEVYHIALANMFYKNKAKGLDQVFRWSQRTNSTDPPGIEVLNSMMGKVHYQTVISGTPAVSGNLIDAIFSSDEAGEEFDIMLYNYNAGSLDSKAEEDVTLSFATTLPVGTTLYYRNLTYGEKQNPLQNFLENEPAAGWIKDGFDRKGDPLRTLNEAGAAAWAVFENPRTYEFSEWVTVTSVPRSDGGEESLITINTQMPSFSFKKFEFRLQPDFVDVLSPPKYRWTTYSDFEQFSASSMITTTENNLYKLSITGSWPKIVHQEPLNTDLFDQFRIVLKNETSSDVFWLAWYKNGIKSQSRFTPTPGLNDTSFHVYSVDLSSDTEWSGTIDYFHIETANRAGSGVVAIDTIEFLPRDGVVEHSVIVESDGEGWVNPASGSCLTGQNVEFSAIAADGYLFTGWSGDVSGSDNPLSVTINSEMSLMAHFSLIPEKYSVNITSENGTVEQSPNYSEYEAGTELVLNATPSEGYIFDRWTGDIESSDNPVTVHVDSVMDISAIFVAIPTYSITIIADHGAVSISPEQEEYLEGTLLSLTAVPDSGYLFENWGGDVNDTINPLTVVMDSDKTITAIFSLETAQHNSVSSKDWIVYPNPAKELAHLRNVPIGATISLLSMEGKLMKNMKVQERNPSIDVRDIDAGIYLLSVKTGSEIFIMKVLIN